MAQEQGATGSGDEEPGATGSEVPEPPTVWGGDSLVGDGRYRLTHRLGRGGMAEVFAAEDVRLGRTVAVKLLRSDLAEDPVSKARFTREAQSVAGLNHHAVVAVYDSGEQTMNGRMVPYIVMELVNGKTIRELLIDAEAPPAEQALIIVSGVLEALAYSHQHGIVHRDIKPANVIITETGTVKVMDFGIARALHGAAQTMTQTGMVMGTPQYLSPEQALGKVIDTRSDLYAVGCLLYELLTLRPPFIGETPLAVVYQHVQDTPRPPSEVAPEVPPELDGLVMRALAKDPDDRFQSAEEMRGLVQYALRMLAEHGGHTHGLWNTGAVVGVAGTPPMGTATTAMARSETPTGQYAAPMLLGDPNGGAGGRDDHGDGNGRRGRLILVALLALIAIGGGVLVAANIGGEDGPGGSPTQSDTTAPDNETQTEGQETDPETPSAPEDTPQPTEDWTEPETQTPTEPETTPPTEPETTPPTDPETTPPADEGGTDEGGTDEGGTDVGTDDGGTDVGTDDGGTDVGTDDGGTDIGTDDGGTDIGTDGDPNTTGAVG
ncbi:protein kinase domain-containing protein [Streptomyces sp. NBC_01803]|uniref:protein kinase domain-containing protein n=1 Tax=Streptomyces sp. NBC_01803 TaxID=2975946 RepID=UPI002DD8D65B|nr:protein kinase [Streptomyces sp. NBC_01803]WSA45216.1 protein kinase [Streptomyces sp. NBC_01803]